MIEKEHPADTGMRISHEHIYQFVYSKAGEKLNLKSYLLRSHRKRKEKTGRSVRGTCKSRIPGRTDIDERPAAVADRKEFGHWE
jgi:IS30 family transposase